ncbi:MAG: OmpA family protein [Rhizobiaceae bacterium]|nr:OmpA family protein [Rhizobiaceae bacterium]MCV0404872.1 OmpA family protein [Rhizobiaceae bacterium]
MLVVEEENHAASEEGENYFVSMTDMMVGVLFIFIIMLMVFALDFRTKTDDQTDALEAARRAAQKIEVLSREVQHHITTMDEASEVRRQLLTEIRDQLAARNIKVEISPNSDVLRITENAVLFRTGSWTLEGQAKNNVTTIAQVLSGVLRNYVSCTTITGARDCREDDAPVVETVFIEGHTDVTGPDLDNWRLSTARAAETFQQLSTSAPELRTFLNHEGQEILSVSGYSSTRPVDAAVSPEAFAANRRIDLRFVMENDSRERMEQLSRQVDDMRGEVEALINALGGRP